jgi:preprotein translocase subunit YajC
MIFSGLFLSLAQAQPSPRGGGVSLHFFIMMGLVFLVFYLLLIRPQRTRQKKHQEMVENLKPGDKVITSGGIHGTVMGVQKDKLELKIASNVKVDIAKTSIAVILTPQQKEK